MDAGTDTDTDTGELTRRYLARVGLAGASPGDVGVAGLVAAHNRTIPFETLDPVGGVPVGDLSFAALVDKLVDRRRGGYCYEHNVLLGRVLESCGHRVEFLTARVVWGARPGDPAVPRTHQLLAVIPAGAGEGARLVVDVGFGGQTLTSPLRFVVEEVQETRHEPSRLLADGDAFVLQSLIRDEWVPLYRFWDEPQELVDLEVGSWWVSTHPESGFVRNLVVARVTDEARINLGGTRLAVHRLDGGTEKRELRGVDELAETLRDTFGIDVDGIDHLDATLAKVVAADG